MRVKNDPTKDRNQILVDRSIIDVSYKVMSTKSQKRHQASPRSLQDFLTFRLARLNQALNNQVTDVLSKHAQIGLTEWRVLSILASSDAGTARDVANVTGIDPAMISRALKQLEARGLVLTVRDSTDRRARQVRLTTSGRRLYEDVVPVMRNRQEALLNALSPDVRIIIFDAIDKLMDAAQLRDI
jgi:DNA-binding MarR family transcriptional regulator